MSKMEQLAQRCEAADGPDRGLDAEIELATGNWSDRHYEAWHRFQECGESANPPMTQPCDPMWFTSSLDAAMTLVPEGFGVRLDVVAGNGGYCRAIVGASQGDWPNVATLPLALCAAALRARV